LLEKNIRFDTVLIDLQNKPDWYVKQVPTTLVPAIEIDGVTSWESLVILEELEKKFPNNPSLYPEGKKDDVDSTRKAFEEVLSASGVLTWILNEDDTKEDEFRKQALSSISSLESLLTSKAFEGPYAVGEFSLVDCAIAPSLERFAFWLPQFKGIDIRNNPQYPRLTDWYDAMDQRPAYLNVRMDQQSCSGVLRYLRKGEGEWPNVNFDESTSGDPALSFPEAALYACARLTQNHYTVIADAIQGSKVSDVLRQAKIVSASPSSEVWTIVDEFFRLLGSRLLARAVERDLEDLVPVDRILNDDAQKVEIGFAALNHLKKRICVPRDLTLAAKQEMLSAIDELLSHPELVSPPPPS